MQVEMSPCEYIYIMIVAETFLAAPAEITKFYLFFYALESHFLELKLRDDTRGKQHTLVVCNQTFFFFSF